MLLRLIFAGLIVPCLPVASALAAEHQVVLEVEAGEFDRVQTPVSVTIEVPADLQDARLVKLAAADGTEFEGQLTAAGLLADDAKPTTRQLHFVLPELAAGGSLKLTATIRDGGQASGFRWEDTAGEHAELRFEDRPVMRYMYQAVDNSSAERREETHKVYHHVYDPAGTRYITKGPGGLFPHHRGLFYGFNRISYEREGRSMSADVWHNRNGEDQSHVRFLADEAGPVVGRHTAQVAWNGRDNHTFAKEVRQMAAYHVPGGTMIEFASKLQTEVGPIKLDGDPQHAGFQFRAAQDVPDHTKDQTYYVRPDGVGQPGQFRNWPGNRNHADLPWLALSIVIDERRYTVCYLDHPGNPKEARYSERDYGRFGSYFEAEVTEEQPLLVNYRVWVQEGEMTPEQIARLSNDFVHPPQVTVVE